MRCSGHRRRDNRRGRRYNDHVTLSTVLQRPLTTLSPTPLQHTSFIYISHQSARQVCHAPNSLRLFISPPKTPFLPRPPSTTTTMPNPIPEFQIQNFLARSTTALPLSSLPTTHPQDTQCPICHTPYAPPPISYVHPLCPPDTPEYACEVQICTHIFGRRCLERHIRGGMPWSHTCPMCRVALFNAPSGGRREIVDLIDRALERLAGIQGVSEEVRREVEGVEEGLRRVRSLLGRDRWI